VFKFVNYIRELIAKKLDDIGIHFFYSFMRKSFVEGLLQKLVPQSKVSARLRLNVLCWCTSEACKYSIRSAVVMVASITSCSTVILAAKSILQIVQL